VTEVACSGRGLATRVLDKGGRGRRGRAAELGVAKNKTSLKNKGKWVAAGEYRGWGGGAVTKV